MLLSLTNDILTPQNSVFRQIYRSGNLFSSDDCQSERHLFELNRNMKEIVSFTYRDQEGKKCLEDENTEILMSLKREKTIERRKKIKKFSFDSAMASVGHVQHVRTYRNVQSVITFLEIHNRFYYIFRHLFSFSFSFSFI